MFSGNGGIGLAFGLVAGIFLSAFVFIWLSGALPGWWHHDGVLITSSDSLANWMTAIVGIVATVVSIWAVILLNQTLRQTAIATKAAQDAVEVTEAMGRLQTQAYVCFAGTELHFALAEGVPTHVSVRIKFKNTGQTPGRIVYASCFVTFLSDLQAPFRHKSMRSQLHRTKLNIGPGEVRWVSSQPIAVGEIKKSARDGREMVAFGIVEFTDIFDETRRVEDFCVAVAFHSDPTVILNGALPSHDWNAHQDFEVLLL
jgi:hypothetical protein